MRDPDASILKQKLEQMGLGEHASGLNAATLRLAVIEAIQSLKASSSSDSDAE